MIGTFGMLLFQAGTDIAQEIAKGNFIAKVNAASATASLFYATPNPRSGYGYSGIAIYGNRYLLVWDSLTASISVCIDCKEHQCCIFNYFIVELRHSNG